ncbi:Gfo/Idh/MocA family oxidoreductase [bacterium LRH843]|nr:Gfo/Idh/MocA family oxidoreductase [bacterium LRH843]
MTKRIGFIGAGAISEVHHEAIKKLKNATFVGFYESNDALAKKREKEWNVKAYPSLEELLASDEIDIIYVLSPVETHCEHAIQALRAGKHVLVEKPVGMNVEEIKEMDQVAKETGKICFPAHNYIYHPEIIRYRNYMDEGVFGKICSAWMTFNIFHSEELASHYPGVNQQIMTHHLYTTLYLLGKPKTIGCLATNLHYETLDRDDQSIIVLEMESGAQVVLFSSFACDDKTTNPWTYMVKILGTNGGATHSWQDVVYERSIGTLSKAFPKYEELFYYEAEYFIEECINKGKQPLSTLEDAAIVQQLVQLAEEHKGKQFVPFQTDSIGNK